MQKNKFLMIVMAFIFFGGLVYFSETKTYADEGKKWRPPPCCLLYKPEFPPALSQAFGTARPSEYKILGIVSHIRKRNVSINVLSIANKSSIKDLSGTGTMLNFSIPENSDIIGIQNRDYILLIPINSYNVYLPERMYDFIKVQKGLIK